MPHVYAHSFPLHLSQDARRNSMPVAASSTQVAVGGLEVREGLAAFRASFARPTCCCDEPEALEDLAIPPCSARIRWRQACRRRRTIASRLRATLLDPVAIRAPGSA